LPGLNETSKILNSFEFMKEVFLRIFQTLLTINYLKFNNRFINFAADYNIIAEQENLSIVLQFTFLQFR